MALDLCFLSDDGSPREWVAVQENEFYSIIEEANRHKLPLLSRLNDYYEDVYFDSTETLLLKIEISEAVALLHDKPVLHSAFQAFDALLSRAIEENRSVCLLAD